MSYEAPTPPTELSDDLVNVVNDCSPRQLKAIAKYAEALAEYRERETRTTDDDKNDIDSQSDERPKGVPSKATTTIKEINGNRYHYWQWRDGEKVRSKYKGPVNSKE